MAAEEKIWRYIPSHNSQKSTDGHFRMVEPLTSLGYTQAPEERKLDKSVVKSHSRPQSLRSFWPAAWGQGHPGKSNRHMSAIFAINCSCSCRHRNISRFIRYRHLPWETVTTNTIEDGQGINSDGKEVIITIEGVIAKKDLRVETSGLIDDASHLGKIDVEAIIANLIEGEEIALGDTMKWALPWREFEEIGN